MMQKLQKAFSDNGLKMQKLWDDWSTPEYIDPFTIFGMFNKSIKEESRVAILRGIAKEFNVQSEVPVEFEGIPTINPLMANFYFFDCDMQDIDNLWEVFDAAIILADKDNAENREVFSEKYDQVLDQYGVKWNITMGLYWIRPYRFLNLDSLNRKFLRKAENITLEVSEIVDSLRDVPDAETYLEICDKCLNVLREGTYSYKTFPELSLKAWLDKTPGEPDPAPLKDIHYWTYSPGERASMWEVFYDKQVMGIGWPELGNLTQYKSKEELQQKMAEVYEKDSSFKNSVLAVWQFVNELKIGDIVYVKQGVSKILGYGEVISEYEYNEAYDKEYPNIRRMDWKAKGSWDFDEKLAIKTLTDITGYKKLEDLRFKLGKQPEVPVDCRYWWLNANPKIWSFSSLAVGDKQSYNIFNENGNPRRIPQNFAVIKPGDIVIGYETHPVKKVVALAEVTGKDKQKVTFKKIETFANAIEYKTLKELDELQEMEYFKNPQGSLFKLSKAEYDCILNLIREENPRHQQVGKPYNKAAFLDEVFMTEELYDELVDVLEDKKNIILQGAPGVGKTFAATRLAYSIMGLVDNDRIKSVQFHQNYSYEDFIMGYKPDGEGFALNNGIFYKFCKEAENHPDQKYFFIIDEINRGNMSKIFGELLSRIENGYRGKKITLAYSDELFSVPANLCLIGLMNTADRSLAMIDYALRRRFSFFEMKPGFETDGFKKYQAELGEELFDALIQKIKELNKEIENDKTLGSGFCIGHSYFCDLKKEKYAPKKLRAIVKYDILPMLKEYWFDEQDKYEGWESRLLDLFK